MQFRLCVSSAKPSTCRFDEELHDIAVKQNPARIICRREVDWGLNIGQHQGVVKVGPGDIF